LRDLKLLTGTVDFFLDLLDRLKGLLFLVPSRSQDRRFLLQFGQLGLELLQPVLRRLVGFLL
jgi:hypothetical protein